jgi:hypothetical protein
VESALGTRHVVRPVRRVLPIPSARGGVRLVGALTDLRTPGSAAERWAHMIGCTLYLDHDPKTIWRWSKSVGLSRSVLCECCRLVHVMPNAARDFARVMRAIWRSGKTWQPEIVFDLADTRTLKKLLQRAGLAAHDGRVPTIDEFLTRQQWINPENPALEALRTLLTRLTPNPGV